MRFLSKVALVTGGGNGIGKATALALAREGADVAVAGLILFLCSDAASGLTGQALNISAGAEMR